MGVLGVELGIPYTGWPLRQGTDYAFGQDRLDSELADRLVRWAKDFNFNFDEEKGWSSPEAREQHAVEGLALRDEVQAQLGPKYRVYLNRLGSGTEEP